MYAQSRRVANSGKFFKINTKEKNELYLNLIEWLFFLMNGKPTKSYFKTTLTIWTLEITSVQFTLRNCNLRPLPHHLLKCVISTQISRRAVQTHLSVSASTIRGMTLHSGLPTFLIWTATFPPIQLTVSIYLN